MRLGRHNDSKGDHLYKMGDEKGAEEMWKNVISLEPDFPEKHQSNLQQLLQK